MLKLNKVGALALAVSGLGAAQAVTVNANIAGWNLLGYSDAADVVVADAFGDKTKVTTVWKWTATGWAFYSPDLADGGGAYAASKGYDFLTTIKSGDGFWVNAKSTFSVTLPASAAPVVSNPEALAAITAGFKAFSDMYATALPTSTTVPAPMFDDTFLTGGVNKASFLQGMVDGSAVRVGTTFFNIILVNPSDAGAVPNDATHQWFTFDATGGGPANPWLFIKNTSGNWLNAGDQRQLSFYLRARAIKHVAVDGLVSYSSEVNSDVSSVPTAVTQVLLTGPGVTQSTELKPCHPLYAKFGCGFT